jgi:hypothetical protein
MRVVNSRGKVIAKWSDGDFIEVAQSSIKAEDRAFKFTRREAAQKIADRVNKNAEHGHSFFILTEKEYFEAYPHAKGA